MNFTTETETNFGTLSSFGIKELEKYNIHAEGNFGTLSSFGIKEQF